MIKWRTEEPITTVGMVANASRVFAGSVAMVSCFLGTGPAPAIKRLDINPYQWGTECISGDVWAGNATSFPMSIGLVNQPLQYLQSFPPFDDLNAVL